MQIYCLLPSRVFSVSALHCLKFISKFSVDMFCKTVKIEVSPIIKLFHLFILLPAVLVLEFT